MATRAEDPLSHTITAIFSPSISHPLMPFDLHMQVLEIQGGEQHTLALTRSGRVLSFGAATYGMLGRAELDWTRASENHPDPRPVDGLEQMQVWVQLCVEVVLGHPFWPVWGGDKGSKGPCPCHPPWPPSLHVPGRFCRRGYECLCLLHL